ncbi:MAG TPA: glutaredoxin 3 [Gammaproteobacteria bacterium]|nr:glutaredoxin 3 [Gammaproteobacteria bacterium]
MAKVVIYSTHSCPYCVRARRLLDAKGVSYDEVRVDLDPHLRGYMEQKSQRRSVPQIFIDEYHVGGFEDMWKLDQSGELDALLGT